MRTHGGSSLPSDGGSIFRAKYTQLSMFPPNVWGVIFSKMDCPRSRLCLLLADKGMPEVLAHVNVEFYFVLDFSRVIHCCARSSQWKEALQCHSQTCWPSRAIPGA